MILYTEEQLEAAYKTYRMLHARNNVGFIKLEEFRVLFENISLVSFADIDPDYDV